MTNEEYIKQNRDKDVRSLALKKVPEGVDITWCLRQIEGYQLAKKKLPRWAATEGLWFPPRLSMEQCSSEATAKYKAEVASYLVNYNGIQRPTSFADLTGGFGVDFSYMAPLFDKAIYVEQQEVLCEAAHHNFLLLGLDNAEILNTVFENGSSLFASHFTVIFLDPARRDDTGKKVFAIEDCTPDLTQIQDELLDHADYVMVKLSPMLDITQALRSLHCVSDIHVVSVKGECKELIFVMNKKAADKPLEYHCVNLESNDATFTCHVEKPSISIAEPHVGDILIEPNASIMKAGMQDMLAKEYGLSKLHPMSNLYIAPRCSVQEEGGKGIAGRCFRITAIYDFSKQSLKQLQKETPKANITIRNFPSTVAELRKRLKIKEGGDVYIFATTISDGSHALLQCEKK